MSEKQSGPSDQPKKLSVEFIFWFILPFLGCFILNMCFGVPYEKLSEAVKIWLGTGIIHLVLKSRELLICLSVISILILIMIGYNTLSEPVDKEPPVVAKNITEDLSNSINSCIEENSAQCRMELYDKFKIDPDAEVLLSEEGGTPMKISGGLDVFLASTAHLMEIERIKVLNFKKSSTINQLIMSTL